MLWRQESQHEGSLLLCLGISPTHNRSLSPYFHRDLNFSICWSVVMENNGDWLHVLFLLSFSFGKGRRWLKKCDEFCLRANRSGDGTCSKAIIFHWFTWALCWRGGVCSTPASWRLPLGGNSSSFNTTPCLLCANRTSLCTNKCGAL